MFQDDSDLEQEGWPSAFNGSPSSYRSPTVGQGHFGSHLWRAGLNKSGSAVKVCSRPSMPEMYPKRSDQFFPCAWRLQVTMWNQSWSTEKSLTKCNASFRAGGCSNTFYWLPWRFLMEDSPQMETVFVFLGRIDETSYTIRENALGLHHNKYVGRWWLKRM